MAICHHQLKGVEAEGWEGGWAWRRGMRVGMGLKCGAALEGGSWSCWGGGMSLDGARSFGFVVVGEVDMESRVPLLCVHVPSSFSCLGCVSYFTFLVIVYFPFSFTKDPFPTNNLFNPAERCVNLLRKVSSG